MLAEPGCKLVFGHLACSDREHGEDAVCIARNHASIDGNKCTAFVAVELFLRLNGWQLVATDADCVLTMLAVATGDMTEDEFAAWLRLHASPFKESQ